jgi:phenylacetate-CoA ligase
MKISKIIKDIPIYKNLYKDILETDFSEKDLSKLPILTKKDIIFNFPENFKNSFLQKQIEDKNYEFMATSGTTDERMLLIRPKNWWLEIEKRYYTYLNKAVPTYTDFSSKAFLTTAICSNTICFKETPAYEKRIVNGMLYLNITSDPNSWTKDDIKRMIEEIDIFKPQCFQADPIYMCLFLKFIKKYNLSMPKHKPKCLVLSYELVPNKCIEFIKTFWDIATHILYGTTECGMLFYSENEIFKFMDDDTFYYLKPFPERKDVFELLITSFRNPYMPFVNYSTGDLVLVENNQIKQFMGRVKDITTYNEKLITIGDIDNIIAKTNNDLLFYQIDLKHEKKLIFKYVLKDDSFLNETQISEITDDLNSLFQNLQIECTKINQFLPAPSGKFNIMEK